jgi:hypothetical protein
MRAKILTLLFATLVMASTAAMGKIIYVDADVNGENNGSSWADAFNYLQDALASVYSGDEIRVAQGIYKPDQGIGILPGDRTATFQLKNGVVIKGGYAGFSEPAPDARDIKQYKTILSGDIGIVSGFLDNCYHVVNGSDTDTTTILDGFTISGGNADVSNYTDPYSTGGGMYNNSGNPTVTNCTFLRNSALWNGGGMNNYNSNPTIMNCAFYENSAVGNDGGAMNNDNSSPTIINCRFIGNLAYDWGGAIRNIDSSKPTISNCTFIQNNSDEGGAVFNYDNCRTKITNCTFQGNSASNGSALGCDSGYSSGRSYFYLTNCILWDGGNEIWNNNGSTISITYSSIQGGWVGEGNIYVDPGFVHPRYEEPPPFASEPNPADRAINVNIIADLSWIPGQDALSHDVYFGISYPPPFIRNQTSTTFDPGTMAYNTTHYWRIDEISGSGVTAGDTWSFSTIITPPPPPQPPPPSPLAFSSTSYTPYNIFVVGDYHLLPGSPCIDAGYPGYQPEANETDLDGNPRIMGTRIDMGAYEHRPPIYIEARITPHTINPASTGKWITSLLWLGEGYDVNDVDYRSVLLEYKIEPEQFWLDEEKQVVMARFNRKDIQGILKSGEVELTISFKLTDGTVFEGSDAIRVIVKGGGKLAKPGKANNPNPADGTINVSLYTAFLSWAAGPGATSHDVYFGTSNPPPFICNQTATIFNPGTMDYRTTYYWRIDEVNKWGETSGDIWSFMTFRSSPIPPPPAP